MDIHGFGKVVKELLNKPANIGTVLLLVAFFLAVDHYSHPYFSEFGRNSARYLFELGRSHAEKIGNNSTTIQQKLVPRAEWSKIVQSDTMSESFSVRFEKFLSKELVRIQLHSPEIGRYTAISFDAERGFTHSFSSGNEFYSFQLQEINAQRNYVTFTLEIEEQDH